MSQRDRAEKKTKRRHGSGPWHPSKAAEKAQRATVKAARRARRRLDDAIVEAEQTDVPTETSAKFHVADSFFLRTRNLLVLAGDVLEGEVSAGMSLVIPLNGSLSVTFRIASVEFVDFADGKSHVALTLDYEDPEELEIFMALEILGETLRCKSP